MNPYKKQDIILRPVTELIPYARNARTHSDAQVLQIAASIKEFGWTNPILIDKDSGIIAGHGRVLAAQKLNIAEVPCICLDHLSDAQRKAYILADNKLALNAGWDNELLAVEFGELAAIDFDLSLTGFTDDEIKALSPITVEGLTDPDEVPPVPDEPVARLGDIWKLGGHRLMCGDSTDAGSVALLMDGRKADVCFTSPPYNANAKTGEGDIFNKKKAKSMYQGAYIDNLSSDEYIDFAKKVLEICFSNTEGFIFWNVSYNAKSKNEYIKQIFDRIDFLIEQICWKKSSTIPFKGCMMRDWEPIFVFSTGKNSMNLEKVASNHWEISNTNSQQENHKACFPFALPEKGINLVHSRSGVVFEPFGGSGSTLIACEKTNRNCYMMELDEKYCDVIIKRWEDFTGKKAELITKE